MARRRCDPEKSGQRFRRFEILCRRSRELGAICRQACQLRSFCRRSQQLGARLQMRQQSRSGTAAPKELTSRGGRPRGGRRRDGRGQQPAGQQPARSTAVAARVISYLVHRCHAPQTGLQLPRSSCHAPPKRSSAISSIDVMFQKRGLQLPRPSSYAPKTRSSALPFRPAAARPPPTGEGIRANFLKKLRFFNYDPRFIFYHFQRLWKLRNKHPNLTKPSK